MNMETVHMSLVLIAGAILLPAAATAGGENEFPEPPVDMFLEEALLTGTSQTAVLAGGCFWGVEGVFEKLIGVIDVVSGYSGGDESTANYYRVASGSTRHAESVEIVFDPSEVTYGTLLEVFFAVAHDPTELNYQGPDYGPQYRSAIFYATEDQRRVAEAYIESLEQAKTFRDPIVTEVVPLDAFFPAEEYHQDFMKKNPTHGYIVYWDLPKIEQLERQYAELIDRN